MKDAISYIRVSSEEQADSGLGLEAQRQRIAAYCMMKALHLAEEFEDPGISAVSRSPAAPQAANCWPLPERARPSWSWRNWTGFSDPSPTPPT